MMPLDSAWLPDPIQTALAPKSGVAFSGIACSGTMINYIPVSQPDMYYYDILTLNSKTPPNITPYSHEYYNTTLDSIKMIVDLLADVEQQPSELYSIVQKLYLQNSIAQSIEVIDEITNYLYKIDYFTLPPNDQ